MYGRINNADRSWFEIPTGFLKHKHPQKMNCICMNYEEMKSIHIGLLMM